MTQTNITPAQAREMRAYALESPERPECPKCKRLMHKNGKPILTGSGGGKRQVFKCQSCGTTKSIKLGKGGNDGDNPMS